MQRSVHTAGKCLPVLVLAAFAMLGATAMAADQAAKDQAVAMVKKAVAAIKSDGTEKTYPAIDDKSGPFVEGDIYVAVVGLDGTLLAYGGDGSKPGDNVMNLKDVDGKEVVKERIALAKTEPSFWQGYKYENPVTKTIEPKQMYCERLDATVVCAGVYQ